MGLETDFSSPIKLEKPGWPPAPISNISCLLCRISISVHMTDMKEKIEMAKEGNVSDSRGKSSKVKSTPADLKGVKQQPDKLKLQQSPKNIISKPDSEVKGDNKQNELAPQTGKQKPFLSKPKPGEKAEEKSELKCEPITSQNTSAKDPLKDAGVKVKLHQEAAKAEKSPADTKSERRGSETAGANRHDAQQCTGETPEKNKSLAAGKALPIQGEIIGKLLIVTLETCTLRIFAIPAFVQTRAGAELIRALQGLFALGTFGYVNNKSQIFLIVTFLLKYVLRKKK